MTDQEDTSPSQSGGQHTGGGHQGEMIEGSFTSGGSLPGAAPENRSFGAGRTEGVDQEVQAQTEAPGQANTPDAGEGQSAAASDAAGPIFEGQGEDTGAIDTGEAGPGTERSGYGNTPPR